MRSRPIMDTTLVRLLDLTPETGGVSDLENDVLPVEIWRGTLAEFEATNTEACRLEDEDSDTNEIRLSLIERGFAIIGGGAAAPYRLEVVDGRYLAVTLTPKVSVLRAGSGREAAHLAGEASQNGGIGLVVEDGEIVAIAAAQGRKLLDLIDPTPSREQIVLVTLFLNRMQSKSAPAQSAA